MKLVCDERGQITPVLSFCAGNYTLGEYKINGKHHWINFFQNTFPKNAVWWDMSSKCWVIGSYADKGNSIAKIRGPPNSVNLPHKTTSGWCYWNDSNEIDFEDYWHSKQGDFQASASEKDITDLIPILIFKSQEWGK